MHEGMDAWVGVCGSEVNGTIPFSLTLICNCRRCCASLAQLVYESLG